jgi:oxygen-independent coproporphyrinogen-3 oxidase
VSASLYLHIPFCARRCPYCDFAVSVNRRQDFRSAYVKALHLEIDKNLVKQPKLSSIYFGGGTPTELAPEVLNGLLAAILERAEIDDGTEISLEANPENLNLPFLRELKAGGWNRISLGVQALDNNVLQGLGRAHSVSHVQQTIDAAREAGFENISLDLIYGLPFTPLSIWKQTVQSAVQLGVEHVSCYSLTIEEGTKFGLLAARGELVAGDDDSQADLMELADEVLAENGFFRYEVSNWAKSGFESHHNQNYWRGGNYYGFGCGAHGHFEGHRFWNERDTKTFITRMEDTGSARADEENLTSRERLSELVALGLRTREGFNLDDLSKRLNLDVYSLFIDEIRRQEKLGALQLRGTQVLPEANSLALADGIALKLLEKA